MPILEPQRRPARDPESNITTVVLHGRLAGFSDGPMLVRAGTTSGAVRALCAIKPGFGAAFSEGNYRLIRGDLDRGFDIDETMLMLRTGGRVLHILPMAAGAKSGMGIGKIVIGAVIVIASLFTYGAAADAFGPVLQGAVASVGIATGALAGFATYGQIAIFGAALVLGGISALLSPQQKKNTGQSNASFGLSGRINTVSEGAPVPIVYGRTLVGSTVISVGYAAEDLLTNLNAVSDNNTTTAGNYGSTGTANYVTGYGGGGKGGGGGSEAQNTLQSDAVVRIIDLLGEGQLNLVNGAQSIFFNNTPLQANDGTYNFQGVNWEVRIGLPDQDPVSGYPSAEDTIADGRTVSYATGPIVNTVTAPTANAASVTLQWQSLYSADTTTGYLGAGPSQSYMIEVQPVDGAWVTVVDTTLTGMKCTAPYQVTYRFDLPLAGTPGLSSWIIRVSRLTPDNTLTNVEDTFVWYSYDVITDHPMIYPDSAYIALTIDAASFGSSIPTRTYEVERLDVQVPLNFDPVARTYASTGPGTSGGTWDGVSWQTAVTDDPAWCLLDLISNTRYGLGLPAAATELTAYDLYTISQYCAQSVPDGFGGSEPRYTLNVVIATQADAYVVVQNMVSAFRGMTYWGGGTVVVTADMPTTPTALVTQANVIGGVFTYEGTGLNTRHNVCRVTWIDPGNRYQPAVEVVDNIANVALRGIVPTDIVAFGCQSRGLANRLGKWMLDSEQNQTETVTFSASFDQISVRPGMIFALSDPSSFTATRMGGRVRMGATTTSVPLDAYLEPTGSNDSYQLTVQMPDGTLASNYDLAGFAAENDANGVLYSILTLSEPMPMVPDPDAVYVVTSTSIAPTLWQCVGMTEPNRGTYQIVGLSYDSTKYERVEDGIQLQKNGFSSLIGLLAAPVPPPQNVFAQDYLVTHGTTTTIRVTVSWSSPVGDPRAVSYQIRAVSNIYSGQYSTTSTTYDIDNLAVGLYIFGVRTVGSDGRTSTWIDGAGVDVNGVSDPPSAPTSFTALGGTRRIQLTWVSPINPDILHYELWRSNSFDAPPYDGASLLLTIMANSYTDNDSLNLQPLTTWWYWIRAISTTLAQGTFATPVFAETTDLIADAIADGILTTAAFAQSITPVALIPDVTAVFGQFDGQIAYDEASAALYRWSSGSTATDPPTPGGWNLILPPGTAPAYYNSIIAGIGSFGGLKSAQIAAGAIEAVNLASVDLITENAQIGNAVIETANIADLTIGANNIAYNGVSESYVSQAMDTVTTPQGEALSVVVNVGDPGQNCVIFIRLSLGANIPPASTPSDGGGTGGDGGGSGDGGGDGG